MKNKISITGFLRNERVNEMHTTPISNAYNLMDGEWLDELDILATLKTQEDFEQLIRVLEIHKHCFKKTPKE